MKLNWCVTKIYTGPYSGGKRWTWRGERVGLLWMDEEISQRIRSGWKVCTTIKDLFKAKLDKTLCADLFNSPILLVMLHASEMWAITKKNRLVKAQRAMEWSMLGILYEYIQIKVIHDWRKSEVQDHQTLKAEVSLGQVYPKVQTTGGTCTHGSWYLRD